MGKANFNPTLVRLGLSFSTRAGPSTPHISIPLWFDWGPTRSSARTACVSPISIPLWFDWGQWHHLGAMRLPSLPYFNPTLVRLGRGAPLPYAAGAGAFQSHFGSIGARGRARRPPAPRDRFQSHFGSIGAWRCRRRAPSFVMISIPLWFDWGENLPPRPPRGGANFNPTLVRLGRGRRPSGGPA